MKFYDMDKFKVRLNNFILYSKGWYEPVNKNISKLDFYKKILKLDGYDLIKSYNDVISVILIQFDEYNKFLINNNKNGYSFFQIFNNVKERMSICGISYEEAIISVIMSYFMEMSSDEIELKCPFYDRKLFKNGISFSMFFWKRKVGITYKEQNNFARSMFFKQKII